MDHGAACEVNRRNGGSAVGGAEDLRGNGSLGVGQDAAAPDHVGQREVDDGGPQAGKQEPHGELHTASQRAGDESGGNSRRTWTSPTRRR